MSPKRQQDTKIRKAQTKRVKPATAKRRSNKGCESCKRLKIKCDEARPACEYCCHRRRVCVYPHDKDVSISPSSSLPEFEDAQVSSVPIEQEQPSQSESPPLEVGAYDHYVTPLALSLQTDPDGFISPNSYHLDSSLTQRLNSVKSQLGVSSLELRLLKFFQDFGSSFFTLGAMPELEPIWTIDVPQLWKTSEMLRNSLYALSAVKLWSFYQSGSLDGSGISMSGIDAIVEIIGDPYDQNVDSQTDGNMINLVDRSYPGNRYSNGDFQIFQKISGYFIKALDSLNSHGTEPDFDSNLTLFISNIVLFAFLSIHPAPPIKLVKFKDEDTNFGIELGATHSHKSDDVAVLDALGIFRTLSTSMGNCFGYLVGTRFAHLGYFESPHVEVDGAVSSLFPFLEHLKRYVKLLFDNSSIYNLNYLTYINALNILRTNCYAAFTGNHPIPIFKSVLQLSDDAHFIDLIRQKDHTACKIFYYYTSLCSIFVFKMFPVNSMWDEFNQFYRLHCFNSFGTWSEDSVDENLFKLAEYIDINRDLFFTKRHRYMGMLASIGNNDVQYKNELGNLVSIDLKQININWNML
ncbi:hypothetical protein WICPIJ_004743 [Wickerhamomyces pijperi]|uniref:Zn(2)-C6 fungal-type domain-containing protein n=1 Tax=Wickerhamomyces pijperi TaxID=599730 RepID=A0A9P8Q4V7_WICPI|nr:hypothetical protein WICPIJ_004743 [Wickerhamomyces pijperi]